MEVKQFLDMLNNFVKEGVIKEDDKLFVVEYDKKKNKTILTQIESVTMPRAIIKEDDKGKIYKGSLMIGELIEEGK